MFFCQLNEWNQVGATYDNTTGVAQLWHNGKMVKSRNIGQIKLATQYPIRIGARDGDERRFAGKISCLQIYNKALDEQQIGNLKSCPVKGMTLMRLLICHCDTAKFLSKVVPKNPCDITFLRLFDDE